MTWTRDLPRAVIALNILLGVMFFAVATSGQVADFEFRHEVSLTGNLLIVWCVASLLFPVAAIVCRRGRLAWNRSARSGRSLHRVWNDYPHGVETGLLTEAQISDVPGSP